MRTLRQPFLKLGLLLSLVIAADSQTFPTTYPARVLKSARPTYTQEALDAKLEGAVLLSFTVETDGTPSEIIVLRSLGKGLDEKAVECLQQWRFHPATNSLGPIPSKVRAEISFRLPPTPSQ